MFEPVVTSMTVDIVVKPRVRKFEIVPLENDARISVTYEIEESVPSLEVSKIFKWQQDFLLSAMDEKFLPVQQVIFQFCGEQMTDPRTLVTEAKDAPDANSIS